MPYREAGDAVNGQSQNIALVTNTSSFVQVVLYLELKPACGRIGGRPMEQGFFVFEKYHHRRRKNILIAYRGLLYLIERRFELFMNVVLFRARASIQEIINDILTEDIILCLIRADMAITNGVCWKEYAIIRDSADSGDYITRKMGKAKESKESKATKAKKKEIEVRKTFERD